MDPDENLKRLREEIATYSKHGAMHVDTGYVCELIDALDQWLSKGGMLPKAWGDARKGKKR